MKRSIKKYTCISAVLLATSITSTAFAQSQLLHCPTLTAKDVQSLIDKGVIATEQSYTLADEAGVSRAQVLLNESTANPFDTYYFMMGSKHVNNQNYAIYVGNVLGKDAHEAKDRAKQILIGDEKNFNGRLSSDGKECVYKEVHASPAIANYPFKSSYESVSLVATLYQEESNVMRRMKVNKQHS